MEIVFSDGKTHDSLQTLEDAALARVNRSLDLLEQYGNKLRYPHTSKVTPKIFELRIVGGVNVRIFFAFHRSQAVILHAFIKKSQKLPPREIHLAQMAYNRLH